MGSIREESLADILVSHKRRSMFEWSIDEQMKCRICDRKDEAINVALDELSRVFVHG